MISTWSSAAAASTNVPVAPAACADSTASLQLAGRLVEAAGAQECPTDQ